MTSKRVSAPADLMSEFDDDDAAAQIYRSTGGKPIQTAFKQPTFTPTQTLVQPTSAPKKSAPPQKTISQPKPTTQKAVPPKKAFTNGLFRPLTDQQIDMLEREYYTNKNMVGRDKLFFIGEGIIYTGSWSRDSRSLHPREWPLSCR